MQVSNDHGHLHTSLLMLLNIPKTSGGKWVKGQSQRQRVPKTLGLGKDSKQARTSLRVMGPSQEVHKGPPTMYARGQQSCELGREGSTWGSCSTGRPGQTSLVQCCETGVTVHKKHGTPGQKGSFRRTYLHGQSRKAAENFQKDFTAAWSLTRGEMLCYARFRTLS